MAARVAADAIRAWPPQSRVCELGVSQDYNHNVILKKRDEYIRWILAGITTKTRCLSEPKYLYK